MRINLNYAKEVVLNDENYLKSNPINKTDVKRKRINGKYVYERFYLIDFLDIRKDSYVISSFGRIFSLINNREIFPNTDTKKNNYKTVILPCNNGSRIKFPLHVLVARAFVPKTASDKKMNRVYVHHKNWDNDYNYFWNLEWRSPLEISAIGKIQNKRNVEEEDVVKVVCRLLENGETIVDIFQMIEGRLSKDKISKIKNRSLYITISSDYHF